MGISSESYGLAAQNPERIWTAAAGAKITWSEHPDGNALNLTQLS